MFYSLFPFCKGMACAVCLFNKPESHLPMEAQLLEATPTTNTYWWDAFEDFYFGGRYFPFGLSLLCLVYGLWILLILYLISFY